MRDKASILYWIYAYSNLFSFFVEFFLIWIMCNNGQISYLSTEKSIELNWPFSSSRPKHTFQKVSTKREYIMIK